MMELIAGGIALLIFVMGWLIKAIVSLTKTLNSLDKKQAVFGERFDSITTITGTHTLNIGEIFLRLEVVEKELAVIQSTCDLHHEPMVSHKRGH